MASARLSFLKALENPSPESKNLEQNDGVYVHPMVRRSASALSTESLEMCTESLGSETGSVVSESGDEFCAISMAERERLRKIQRTCRRNFGRKTRRSDFPPPLTSISGTDGAVKVRHHREGGRLIIKAVSFSNCGANFQVERTNGRLKLSLLKDCHVDCESGGVETEKYEGDEGESDDDVAAEVGGGHGGCRWDMDGKRWIMPGKGEFRMLTRCKEGGNGNKVLPNWGSSCVAIS